MSLLKRSRSLLITGITVKPSRHTMIHWIEDLSGLVGYDLECSSLHVFLPVVPPIIISLFHFLYSCLSAQYLQFCALVMEMMDNTTILAPQSPRHMAMQLGNPVGQVCKAQGTSE